MSTPIHTGNSYFLSILVAVLKRASKKKVDNQFKKDFMCWLAAVTHSRAMVGKTLKKMAPKIPVNWVITSPGVWEYNGMFFLLFIYVMQQKWWNPFSYVVTLDIGLWPRAVVSSCSSSSSRIERSSPVGFGAIGSMFSEAT